MDVMVITFQAVAALLGIGVLGFWIIGRKRVTADTLGFLSSLSIDIAVPCLTLSSLIIDFSPEQNPDWWRMPIWWVGFAIIALVLALLSSFWVKKEFRGEFITGVWFQNGLFFPILILIGMFGAQNPYLPLLFLFVFLHPTVMFSTYSLFYKNKTETAKLNWRRVVNPVMVTTIVGLGVALIGLKPYIPQFVNSIILMVGAMASPLFMLILGGTIYHDFRGESRDNRQIHFKEIIKFVAVKNLLFPLIFLALLAWIRPSYPLALIIILEAAVPPVTSIPIFAERSGGNRALASQFILGSFLVSIISIPGMILLFNQFFPRP
jgi:malate permease and related proteins